MGDAGESARRATPLSRGALEPRERALLTLLAVPPALLLIAIIDATRVPTTVYGHELTLAPAVLGQALLSSFRYLMLPFLFLFAIAALQAFPVRRWPWRGSRHAALLALTVTFCVAHYAIILRLDTLPVQPVIALLYVGLAGFLTLAGAPLLTGSRRLVALGWAIPIAAFPSAVFLLWLNEQVLAAGYPAFHLGVVQISFMLLHAGFVHLLGRLRLRRPGPRGVAIGAAIALALALMGGSSSSATTYFRHYTFLGQATLAYSPMGPDTDPGGPRPPDDTAAVERFARWHNLPQLAPDFDPRQYNVLLIMTEATRFTETSFANPSLDTTPRLLAWARRDAFGFSRAYSPSSGTLQTCASLFTMTYPSAVHLETYHRRWRGRVLDANHTVAEIFAESGYDTFWIGHNYHGLFTAERGIRGLDQGFAATTLTGGEGAKDDARLADLAITALAERADQRFFGWVSFVSPHARYVAHYDGLPADTPEQRYRQEIRYMDSQVGRVLDALDQLGLAERTIVVFTADHGEEFHEHGGTHHGATVYEEVVHVPLLVRIPGMQGRMIDAPTSSMYVFPWLMLEGGPEMRQAAQARLTSEVGPVLRDTGGAVTVELIGHDRMKSALVYPDRKLLYDFHSHLVEVYDLARDPGEQTDLRRTDSATAAASEAVINAYRRVRYRKRNAVVGR